MANPNYTTINAAAQTDDPDSVFTYYRKLISLRRESAWKDLIVYGIYTPLALEDPDIYAYTRELDGRTLLVVCNLSAKERRFAVGRFLPDSLAHGSGETLLSNGTVSFAPVLSLSPWDAAVWEIH